MRFILASIVFALLLCCGKHSQAQISPGDLAEVHAQLEGISNCTKCHTLGSKVSNEKCLQCHTEVSARIKSQKGYHSSVPVSGKACVSCHNDHHGKKFQIIRFNPESFDHLFAGYKLQGAHAKQECKKCHKPENISVPAIKNKKFTYLGLSTNCGSCHTDYHQNTLSLTCSNCHGFDNFKPAVNFIHNSAKFKLSGKHVDVPCVKCHKITVLKGLKFQEFTGIPFQGCVNCHDDPHNNKFGKLCSDCHVVESFQDIKGNSKIDHSKTNFKLEDKHQQVACKSCHKGNISDPVKHSKCLDCHPDFHKAQFEKQGVNQDCSVCHDTKGFNNTSFTTGRHKETNYALEGKHLDVDCLKCHKKSDTWNFRNLGKQCKDCHNDYHEKQFVNQGGVQDCADCHNVAGFSNANYTIEQHDKGNFQLKGAHLATPCNACHLKNNKWAFRDIGKKCKDCHQDIHQNSIDIKYYPDHSCESCHNPEEWASIAYDHSQTNFKLSGVHATTPCRKCHFENKPGGQTEQRFAGLPQDCNGCHTDNHNHQFDENGKTECIKCHSSEAWTIKDFDHNKTGFKLDGRHEHVPCNKCHVPVKEQQITYVLYKIKDTRCESCH
ncbi:MAG: cytochrome c family protein [Bacteroidetes bacterium]|nr:cytochrome c family protein [Bacteroidota bacterium]